MIPLRDAERGVRRPVVTVALIVGCVAVFGWELLVGASGGDAALSDLFLALGVVPAELTGAAPAGSGVPPAASLLTYMFVHAGWLHLAGNMLYLWIFGNNVEDRLGRAWFLIAYLAGGILAALGQVAIDPTSEVPLVGASGAISTVLGAYLVLFPRARVMSLVFLGFVYQLMEVPAVVLLGFWFVLQLLDGVLSLASGAGAGVAFFAHVGGFLVGLVVGAVVRRLRPPRPASL